MLLSNSMTGHKVPPPIFYTSQVLVWIVKHLLNIKCLCKHQNFKLKETMVFQLLQEMQNTYKSNNFENQNCQSYFHFHLEMVLPITKRLKFNRQGPIDRERFSPPQQ